LFKSRYRDLQAELADALRTIDVLRQSEEKFRRILASVPDVTWTADQRGGTIYISPKILDRYSSPVVDKNGKHHGRIWTFRDIGVGGHYRPCAP
jgi:PAS domain-containing protein